MAPIVPLIYGRNDWPKRWSLSAALAVGAGTQISEAAGEWKELADSLSRTSQFSIADPSGFSMADLAADRAVFEAARAASLPSGEQNLAEQLAIVTPEQLLPHDLVTREDGLTSADFFHRYGGIADPRFKARISQFDAALNRTVFR